MVKLTTILQSMDISNKREVLDNGKNEQWRWFDVLIITLAILFVFLSSLMIFRIYYNHFLSGEIKEFRPTLVMNVLIGLLEGMVLISCVYLFGVRRYRMSWKIIGINPPPFEWFIISGLLGVIAIPISGVIAIVIQFLLGLPFENPQLDFLAPQGFSWFGAIGMLIVGGLMVPIAEEIYFRGVLYRWLRSLIGVWPGILLSSIIFGLVHGDLTVGVVAAFLAFIIAWVYEKSGSIWTAVIIHVINNGFKITALYLLMAFGMPI